jgi:nucleoside-diphosphate-sugar epimerase
MKCFVTGGSGFIGSNLITKLISEGLEVLAMVRSEKAAKTVEDLGATPISVDMIEADRLEKDLLGCSAVFHLATAGFQGGYDHIYQINVTGTKKLVEAAKKAKVPRFIYISTAAIILRGKPVYDADESLVIPGLPQGSYCKTKVLAEEIVMNSNSAEFEIIIIRPPLVWGRGSVVKFLVEARKENKLSWFNHGNYKIPISHVKNLCHAILLAFKKGNPGEMYYIIDKEHVLFRDFLTGVLETQGLEPPKKNMNRTLALVLAYVFSFFWKLFRKKGSPPLNAELIHMQGTEYTISDKKAREELGYEDIITFEEGLDELRSGL